MDGKEPQVADRAPMRRLPSSRMRVAVEEQAAAQAAAEAAGIISAVAREAGARAAAARAETLASREEIERMVASFT